MINLRPDILQALENDQELVSLLGGKRIYYRKAKKAEEFPRITYFELDNRPDGFADNQEIESEILFQVDVWAKSSTTAIHQKVNETMKKLVSHVMRLLIYMKRIQKFFITRCDSRKEWSYRWQEKLLKLVQLSV